MAKRAEIRPDYPEGRRFAEMALVRLLKRRRSWNDVMDITWALIEIEHSADGMEQERDYLGGKGLEPRGETTPQAEPSGTEHLPK